eukprot:6178167-Pleurochrysis_carterae.AAC.1
MAQKEYLPLGAMRGGFDYIPLYTDKAKPLKELGILRTEKELRQRGARRRNRDLGADCFERRSGNGQRGGECGDRKSRRAVAELKRSLMLSSVADVSRSLPERRAFHRRHRTSRKHAAGAVKLLRLHEFFQPSASWLFLVVAALLTLCERCTRYLNSFCNAGHAPLAHSENALLACNWLLSRSEVLAPATFSVSKKTTYLVLFNQIRVGAWGGECCVPISGGINSTPPAGPGRM